MYADIIVDISHESLDRTFTYRVPDNIVESIHVGDYVSIPFGKGSRIINGYVLNLKADSGYDEDKIKDICEIVTGSEDTKDYKKEAGNLIRLAYYIKENYGSTMIQAMKTVLPLRKRTKEKTDKWVSLAIEKDDARELLVEFERKHQVARLRLLKELIEVDKIKYNLVTNKLNVSGSTIKALEEKGIVSVVEQRVYRNTAEGEVSSDLTVLNLAQRQAADVVLEDLSRGEKNTYLLHGITGSGKTEIYMEIIDYVVKQGKQVIVLIPEISLTYQTVMRFYRRYGEAVSTLHSKLSDGEKYDQFERAKKGEIKVMIGPRSALFTPFCNLGLIVIDEEHEPSYKSDQMPKYHARETAIERARLENAFVILGSATPSVNSYYKALSGEYKLLTVDKRAKEALLPSVHIADLRAELRAGNKTILSRELKSMMEDRLNKGEQIMLFLNRRGVASFISCRSCGHVMKCPHCDVSLSRHRNGKLVCHYCGYEQNDVSVCPECGSPYVSGMKAGTESVEQNIKKMFPAANILRMDADTTKKKDDYERILSGFANREADILIGTQMIVKGHDFPYVTLVGILAADMSLFANDYRAQERTFDLLVQAAGRAGRDKKAGDVVIQTYQPEHYSIVAAKKQDYRAFYDEEIAVRSLMEYPPCSHMLLVLVESLSWQMAESYLNSLADMVSRDIIKCFETNQIRTIGPADASLTKLNDVYRRVIYYKAADELLLIKIKNYIENVYDRTKPSKIRVSFDFDPLNGY